MELQQLHQARSTSISRDDLCMKGAKQRGSKHICHVAWKRPALHPKFLYKPAVSSCARRQKYSLMPWILKSLLSIAGTNFAEQFGQASVSIAQRLLTLMLFVRPSCWGGKEGREEGGVRGRGGRGRVLLHGFADGFLQYSYMPYCYLGTAFQLPDGLSVLSDGILQDMGFSLFD